LNFDGFWTGWFGGVGQGTADIGGPSKGVRILVFGGVQFGLAE